MGNSANVKDAEALRNFRTALLRFQDEARRALASLNVENERVLGWIQQDRPQYWKRQLEVGFQQLAEARSSLMKCKMRRTGDFRPTCYDEQQAVNKAKARLELCYKKIQIVKQWSVKAAHEVDEYRSRTNTLNRCIDGDIPRAVALLERMVSTLEKYSTAGGAAAAYDSEADAETASETSKTATSDASEDTSKQKTESSSASGSATENSTNGGLEV